MALPYPILRRLSSTSQSRATPCSTSLRGVPAGRGRGNKGVPIRPQCPERRGDPGYTGTLGRRPAYRDQTTGVRHPPLWVLAQGSSHILSHCAACARPGPLLQREHKGKESGSGVSCGSTGYARWCAPGLAQVYQGNRPYQPPAADTPPIDLWRHPDYNRLDSPSCTV
jgi:hypothetical protein